MTKAFLEITLKIAPENLAQAGGVYTKYRQPFLSDTPGAESKDLLVRTDVVALSKGKPNAQALDARALAAAIEDRFLMSIDRPRRFGAQYRVEDEMRPSNITTRRSFLSA